MWRAEGTERSSRTRQHDLPVFVDEFRNPETGGAKRLVRSPQHAIELMAEVDDSIDGQRQFLGARTA